MASIKEDVSLARNLLASDSTLCLLMDLTTNSAKATQIIPQRQSPRGVSSKPLVSVWVKSGEPAEKVTSNQLVIDIYVPLKLQRDSGVGFDIAKRVREILDRKRVGMGLYYRSTEPDQKTRTSWYKSSVYFDFRSASY